MPNRPKPTAIKLVKGNPGGRPLNKAEPRPPKGIPTCPDWFEPNSYAREMWDRVSGDLDRMGVLSTADGTTLEILCQSYQEYRLAQAAIAREGITFVSGDQIKRNPATAIQHDAWRRVMSGLIEFGLTPASRTKVQTLPLERQENPFAEFASA